MEKPWAKEEFRIEEIQRWTFCSGRQIAHLSARAAFDTRKVCALLCCGGEVVEAVSQSRGNLVAEDRIQIWGRVWGVAKSNTT